jgi:2-methylfumaryl-CoA isomerase
MPDRDDAPLAGLRILEISSFVAAPLGGMTLAQLGAEVIRIDPLGGAADTTRWPLAPSGASLYWTALNKGKRSVTLDFRSDEGRQTVADLVGASGPDGGIVAVLRNTVRTPPRPDPPADHRPPRRQRGGGLHGRRRDRLPAGHRR